MELYLKHPEWLSPEIIPGFPYFRWYGLMYIVAFITAYLLFVYQVKKKKLEIDKDTILNAFFWGIVGILIGARVFYMFFFDPNATILSAPWALLLPFDKDWHFTGYQGMNFYGGVVGAVVGLVLYLRYKRQDILEWGDLLIAGVPLAHTFGRIGNFINGELFGRLTTAPWGMVFKDGAVRNVDNPEIKRIAEAVGINIPKGSLAVNLPRHPTQIYEMLFECLFIWAIIWFIFRNRRPFKGFILGLYIALYGLVRFIIDYFRVPLRNEFLIKLGPKSEYPDLLASPFNISLDQIFSFGMLVLGLVLIFIFKKQADRGKLGPEVKAEKPELRKLRKLADKG